MLFPNLLFSHQAVSVYRCEPQMVDVSGATVSIGIVSIGMIGIGMVSIGMVSIGMVGIGMVGIGMVGIVMVGLESTTHRWVWCMLARHQTNYAVLDRCGSAIFCFQSFSITWTRWDMWGAWILWIGICRDTGYRSI
jgi:hypothetical protein